MASFLRTLGVTSVLLVTVATPSRAQSPADPTGHWEGSIKAPFGELPIVLDIARRDGLVVATFSRADGGVTDFPLSDIEANGTELKMTLKANGGGVMRASIDGTKMNGTFAAFAGTAPFEVRRTGEARFAAPVVNKPISRTLEGAWTARLAAGGDSATFRMTLTNQPDGTATGTIADEHGVEVPLAFTQDGARVTIEITSARSTFSGTLNADGTALEGTYVEGALNTPLVFSKAK